MPVMQSKMFNETCKSLRLVIFNRHPQWVDYKNKEISSRCSYADKKGKPGRFFLIVKMEQKNSVKGNRKDLPFMLKS